MILGTTRSGQNHTDAEYPPINKNVIFANYPIGRFFVLVGAGVLGELVSLLKDYIIAPNTKQWYNVYR